MGDSSPSSERPVGGATFFAGVLVFVLATFAQWLVTVLWGFSCGGDGGEPYSAPASPHGRACAVLDEHGWLAWLALFAQIGLLGWRGFAGMRSRSARPFVLALALVAVWLAVELLALAALPSTCTPDDESVPGCEHY